MGTEFPSREQSRWNMNSSTIISAVTLFPTLHATMAWLWTTLPLGSALFCDSTQGILVIPYQSFWTAYRFYLYVSRNLESQEISWPLKMELRGCPETSLRIYRYTLRSMTEERRYHLLLGGSPKSRKFTFDVNVRIYRITST